MRTISLIFLSILALSAFSQAPSEKQAADLEKLLSPYRQRVVKILEADKTGQYQRYLADIEVIKQTESAEKRRPMLADLEEKHYAFIRKNYDQAVINHEEMYRGVAKILGHKNFRITEFGGIVAAAFDPVFTIPLKFDAELTCPLNATFTESSSSLAGPCFPTSDAEDCEMSAQSFGALIGGCRTKSALGGNFQLPEGDFEKIIISGQCDLIMEGFAMGIVGYGQSNVKVGVRLTGPGVEKTAITYEDWVVAPLIWFSTIQADAEDFLTSGVFSGNFGGQGTYSAQFYVETFSLGIPPVGFSDIFCILHDPDFIRVSAEN